MSRTRRRWAALAAWAVAAVVFVSAGRAAPSPGEGRVLVLHLEGAISPVTAEAVSVAIDRAHASGYRAVVLEIDTPGGLESSMRSIIKDILASPVPVITWVAPAGARAASAGVFIVMAGDVAAMAPGTNIGAATPVNLQGGMDSTHARKATNDAAAFARTIALQRGRNADWAVRAVREAVAVDEAEAIALHVVDFAAPTLEALLAGAEGRPWIRDGARRTLSVAGLPADRIDLDLRERILAILADPNVAYLLLLLGFYGVMFELQNPGAILPGIVGGICLILAMLALSTLPVNFAGVALILLAITFFVAETQVTSHGMLAAGGILSLVLGSLILYHGDAVRVSGSIIGGATLATALFFAGVLGAGLRAQRRRVTTGAEGMVGRHGWAVGRLSPAGQVRLGGELWNAVSDTQVEMGSEVVVTNVERLTLRVRPWEEASA